MISGSFGRNVWPRLLIHSTITVTFFLASNVGPRYGAPP